MRDNAIILSIEHVRLIITADKVLVPREGYEHNPLRCALALGASGRAAVTGWGLRFEAWQSPAEGAGLPRPLGHMLLLRCGLAPLAITAAGAAHCCVPGLLPSCIQPV